MKLSRLAASALLFSCLCAGDSGAGELTVAISPASREVAQGGVVRIAVSGNGLAGATALARDLEIPFFPRDEKGSFEALLGVDLAWRPGSMGIVIKAWTTAREKRELDIALRVKKQSFPIERLSVPAAFDRFDKATLERIRREKRRMTRLWGVVTPQRWWRGGFVSPVPGKVTSPFGLHRIINGSNRSPHGGVDLRAAEGTKVVAANYGEVVLRDEFFFSGKSIVLDHGGGLYTMYFHLSEFSSVEEGSRVRKGGVIGRVGMTGRVTGPHLHWGVRLNGSRVAPFELLDRPGKAEVGGR